MIPSTNLEILHPPYNLRHLHLHLHTTSIQPPAPPYNLQHLHLRLQHLHHFVFAGVGLQGAGTAAVFSTTFLWLETLMPVTNAIGAAYTVAWNVAVQVPFSTNKPELFSKIIFII